MKIDNWRSSRALCSGYHYEDLPLRTNRLSLELCLRLLQNLLKMSVFRNGGRIFLGALFPGGTNSYDTVSEDTKNYKSFREHDIKETGMDRVKNIFKIDEFGSSSAELHSIYQAGFSGLIIGVIYGGVIHSRTAYMNFMENNQATAFKSHFDAKRQLQDQFTINFAKGAFKWGWRVALFTTSYFGIITCISTYRGKSSLFEYLAAGALTGSMFKFNMGLRGIAAGGIIGGALGGITGCISLLLLRATGTSMEEVRMWQYKWRVNRDNEIRDVFKAHAEKSEPNTALLKEHDEKVGSALSLESVE